MILLFAVILINTNLLHGDEITLFDSVDSDSHDWKSTQNDGDSDLAMNRWTQFGNQVSFAVCRIQGEKQDNFLRTPFIKTAEIVRFVYVEVTYTLSPCTQSRENVSRDNCQQSFYLHAKESNNSDDKSIVNEYTYPVASRKSIVPGEFNTELTNTIPVRLTGDHKGIYFALRDRGACIKLFRFVVKYRYCPDEVTNAVRYNETVLNGEDIQVMGTCVDNASHPPNEPPIRYCHSDGRSWESNFQKSDCYCDRGFGLQDNICTECQSGSYKKQAGNSKSCRRCPKHSMSLPGYTYRCECVEGYKRANEDNVDEECIVPPEMPDKEKFRLLNRTSFSFSWETPNLDEGLDYKIKVSKKIRNTVSDIEANTIVGGNALTITDLEPDQEYVINLKVHNGSVESTGTIFIESTKPERDDASLLIIIIGVLIGLLVLCFTVSTVLCCRRRARRRPRYPYSDCRDPMLEHGKIGTISTHSGSLQHRQYVPISKYANDQEALRNAINIDRANIKLDKKYGQGQFGEVWKGIYHPPGSKPKEIASKVLREGATLNEKRDFLMEASIMVQFEHPNVIELLGIVSSGDQIMIITEFMRNGALKDYLKEIRGRKNIIELLSMARGIVSGMQYLADMNFIHRDLAARNILVDEHDVCKVADFGLSRMLEEDALYYRPQGGQIPVRWTAPEAIQHRKYTQSSDVYSFGVVLWEILTYGEEPWGRQVTNDTVLEYLRDQRKLPLPLECPDCVYQIMLTCWQEDTRRPTFAQLHLSFDKLILTSLDRSVLQDRPMGVIETPAHDSTDEQIVSVQQWLDEMSMSRYQSHFINTGWDSMDKVLLMTTEDLRNIGITLAGHQKKISTAIEYIRDYTTSSKTFPQYLSPDMGASTLPRLSNSNTLPAVMSRDYDNAPVSRDLSLARDCSLQAAARDIASTNFTSIPTT